MLESKNDGSVEVLARPRDRLAQQVRLLAKWACLLNVQYRRIEVFALGKELAGVFVNHLTNQFSAVASTLEFHDQVGDGGWFAGPPIPSGVCHQSFGAVLLDHVGSSLRGAFGNWVEGHSCPKSIFEDRFDGVLFDVVDQHA